MSARHATTRPAGVLRCVSPGLYRTWGGEFRVAHEPWFDRTSPWFVYDRRPYGKPGPLHVASLAEARRYVKAECVTSSPAWIPEIPR